jgi:hypothetical protein
MDLVSKANEWIWHPEWIEGYDQTSAGGFVLFRKAVTLESCPATSCLIQITADTRYKLYINSKVASAGPVKGDGRMWFYDEIDVQPYLRAGVNYIMVRVLRFYHATSHAMSFPRLPYAGLSICAEDVLSQIRTDSSWMTAINKSTRLPTNSREDDFLHIYEDVDRRKDAALEWVPAKALKFHDSHGQSVPWRLSPRMIPQMVTEEKKFSTVHNVRSTVSEHDWNSLVTTQLIHSIRLPAGSSHHVELEIDCHVTAQLHFRFQRPASAGSTMQVTYSECFENEPISVPYLRSKGDRRDPSKHLFGPTDRYVFRGKDSASEYDTHMQEEGEGEYEVFSPFHFRTLRLLAIDIQVDQGSDLFFEGIEVTTLTYPLDSVATFEPKAASKGVGYAQILEASIRTLSNCMHDTYEDCPFYEQLQYAMDTRSSALFTYSVSGDDRLARQAIMQLHNSYSTHSGLTASRAPCHVRQEIPNFSLFWICMVADHFQHFADAAFVRQFVSVIDGVLEHFSRRVDDTLGLVRAPLAGLGLWDFVDWTASWRPYGIPPAVEKSGFSTFTNMLYAYTLQLAADLLEQVDRPGNAQEYRTRATQIVVAVRKHCFDGSFFTDGLASVQGEFDPLSQTMQIWAVLSGAATGDTNERILRQSLSHPRFAPCSTAMAFYMLRALARVDRSLYNDCFHNFWDPWRAQLQQGLTTWMEDDVSMRSDCHAWGCAPLYEFAYEVAGLSPAQPGWAAINFRPRIDLFDAFEATVPVLAKGCRVLAKVAWSHSGNLAQVSVRFGEVHLDRLFCVLLANGEEILVQEGKVLKFDIPLRVC